MSSYDGNVGSAVRSSDPTEAHVQRRHRRRGDSNVALGVQRDPIDAPMAEDAQSLPTSATPSPAGTSSTLGRAAVAGAPTLRPIASPSSAPETMSEAQW